MQRACEPFTWRCTGGNRVDCCCIRRFHDVNVCVHKAAALQLLPLAAAEHKNVLLVNLPGEIIVKLLLLPSIDQHTQYHLLCTYTPGAF